MPSIRRPAAAAGFALALVCSGLVGTAVAATVDPLEFEKAATTIRCDCGCHPQSVKDCACGRAAEMRDEIRALLAGGLNGDGVIARYVAQQGEQIRLAPTATGFNLVAWIGPAFGLLLASAAMVALLRRWKRAPGDDHAASVPPTLSTDPAYRERLRQALEQME